MATRAPDGGQAAKRTRQQVLRALEMPRNAAGARLVRELHTWERVVAETLNGYRSAVSPRE